MTGKRAESPEQAATLFAAREIQQGYTFDNLFKYRNLDGSIIYYRIRFKHSDRDKWVRPMHVDQQGLYHLKEPPELKLQKKPLYGLNLLPSNPDAKIWIVEGEKCADTLNRYFEQQQVLSKNICLTSGGSTSAEKANWQPIQGRQCIIWPDNDECGISYAQIVKRILEKL